MLTDPDGLLTVDGAGVQADLNVHVIRALLDRLTLGRPRLRVGRVAVRGQGPLHGGAAPAVAAPERVTGLR
jgi:hypothetical protein